VKGEGVESPNFAMAGFEWSLCIYHGGADSSDKGMIAVYIFNRSSVKVLQVMKYPLWRLMERATKN
jgi:hypothetical protein